MATMVLPQVLYQNVFREFGFTYSGASVVPGFEPANAFDWRDFSLFQPSYGGSPAYFTSGPVPTSTTIDCFIIWVAFCGSTTSVAIQSDLSSPGVFTTIASFTVTPSTPTDEPIKITGFSHTIPAGRRFRIEVYDFAESTPEIQLRQMTAGKLVTFPIGQWDGVGPPTMLSGVVSETVISVNGSFLARNVRRLDKRGEIDLPLVDPDWVRSVWEPFTQHAKRYPFWYIWNSVGYPSEVAFAAAESIEAPRNKMPPPKMQVVMPIRMLT